MIKAQVIYDNTLPYYELKKLDKSLQNQFIPTLKKQGFCKRSIIKKDDVYHYVLNSYKIVASGYLLPQLRGGFTYDPKTKKIKVWNGIRLNTYVSISDLHVFGLKKNTIDDLSYIDIPITKTLIEKVINNKVKSYKSLVVNSIKISYGVKLSYNDINTFCKSNHHSLLSYLKKFENKKKGFDILVSQGFSIDHILSKVDIIHNGKERETIAYLRNMYGSDRENAVIHPEVFFKTDNLHDLPF